jgi:hypothetical protein
MKYLFFVLLTILSVGNIISQNFKGVVVDTYGRPVIGATVYIKDINQGLLANEDGAFQTTLKPGEHLIEYKCLGYKSFEKKTVIPQQGILEERIILEDNLFELSEVVISTDEDPAYGIMRKAIQKAPVYAASVKEYKAEVYIKGNLELYKVSGFIDKMTQKAEGVKASELKGQVFVQESFNEIEYTSPDKYKQTVKAFSSSIPDDFDSRDAMRFLDGSLYNPKFYGLVSPVNSKAFTYYKYRYEGYYEEDGVVINKIKIIPKVKDPDLMWGYIYIADNTWHIHSAEISCNVYFVREDFTITYQKMQQNVYLPITFHTMSAINVLGTHARYDYYSSLKYMKVEANENVETQIAEEKSKKRQLEITRDENYKVESDSLAMKRDSLYWEQVRVIPIDSAEIASYIKKDSIQHRIDSLRKDHHTSRFSFTDIFTGGKIGGDSSRVTFHYDGLLRAAPEYNFVDGVWLGQKFELSTKIGKHNRLRISPYIYYTHARKNIVSGGNIDLIYAPMRDGKLSISGGSTSEDFNPQGIYRLNNAFSSLIRGRNYDFFYKKEFVNIENKIDLANGLVLGTGIEVARRSGLSNHTDYTWGSRSKIQENPYSGERFDKTSYRVELWYAPYAYYSIGDGKKRYERITSPVFYVGYEEALSAWQTNNSRFRKLRGGIRQNINIDYFSRINYTVSGGGFIGNKAKMHFADYQHFNTSNIFSSLKSLFDSYMLLDNYEASTNEYWIQGNINYTNRYILLKRLPFLQGKMFTESLHLKSLYTPDLKPYSEIGYSVNLTQLLNIGVFTSFEKLKYRNFGIRLSADLGTIKQIVD